MVPLAGPSYGTWILYPHSPHFWVINGRLDRDMWSHQLAPALASGMLLGTELSSQSVFVQPVQ
jgi:hypothetical protein